MSDPLRQISIRRQLPFPGSGRSSRLRMNSGIALEDEELSADTVKSYLSKHQEVLEDYILEYLSLEDLETLVFKKKELVDQATNHDKVNLPNVPALQQRYNTGDIASLQKTLLDDIYENPDYMPLLFELANVIACGVKANTCSLYALRSGSKELSLFVPGEVPGQYSLCVCGPVGPGSTVAAFVAGEKKAVMLKDLLGDDRFPRGIGIEGCLLHSVICIPAMLPTHDLLCVLEFVRTNKTPAFSASDLQSAITAVTWTGATMYQCQINKALMNQEELNEFLLEVSRIIFDDVVQMDQLIEKIMVYTKNLVNADRCALFLVDQEKGELFCNLLDQGKVKDGKPVFSTGEEIRFPTSRGVAGYVARTSEVLNIDDPYNHPEFNREIDKQTGYTTKNILCMPIISKGIVIGVVQMVNKKTEGGFTGADQSSFKMFSVYCALALHYSKVYTKMQVRTAQYKVAMEHLSYHVSCLDSELTAKHRQPVLDTQQIPKDLNSFLFYYKLDGKNYERILPELFIHMMMKLFGKNGFDSHKMANFVMTVKKNYRTVPYHNWRHGWLVAHGMYAMLYKIRKHKHFSELWMKALMIASLCHDVDHRGFTNTFLQKFNEPLAQLYETSTMEQHHYAHTVTIMQQEGNEIFAGKLTPEEYRELLGYIKHAIMATDLAKYLKDGRNLAKLVLTASFSLKKQAHLEDTAALMMTGADLIIMCKPWVVQKTGTENLYEEFHKQGDFEKDLGGKPEAMMDREQIRKLPKNQVEFLKYVCLPCYQTLADIFPELRPLHAGCNDNLEQWECVVAGKSTKLWEPSKSWVDEKHSGEEDNMENVDV